VLRCFDPAQILRFGPQQWVSAFTARALVAVGRVDEARVLFEGLLARGLEGIPRNIRWSTTVTEIAHLCADLRDAERAEALLESLALASRHHGVLPLVIAYAGPLARALARLADLAGRRDEGDAYFEDAIGACHDLGARPMLARTLLEHAEGLARRGDRRRARDRHAEGRALAAALGMHGLVAASESAPA
jgi:hypothetical protein